VCFRNAFRKASALLVFFAFLTANRADVTLITHGFNSGASDWVDAMAAVIERHPRLYPLTNTSTYLISFEQDTTGAYVPRQQKLRGSDPQVANSGQIILLLDWSQLAGTLSGVTHSTFEVAPAVASTLTTPGFIPELGSRPLAEQPLHFIGHSRGGSLIYEVARLLGTQGLWIDHVTTLDPHPLNNDYDDTLLTDVVDAPAHPYANVLFADNYYQVNNSFLGLDPSGQFVVGAYNRFLTGLESGGYGGFAIRHSNVHLWYHGTIDWQIPTTDGGATITGLERDRWWTVAETNGLAAGFLYSRIGGGNRASTDTPAGGTNRISNGLNQLWDFGAGLNQNRLVLDENLLLWPNLLSLGVDIPQLFETSSAEPVHVLQPGSLLPIELLYQGADLQSTGLALRVFLDDDLNPYSGNESSLQALSLPPTGTNVHSFSFSVAMSVAPGLYTLFAEISDATRQRFLYASEWIQVEPGPPQFEVIARSAGNLELSLTGLSGQLVIIESSSDAVSWTPILTNAQPAAFWTFNLPLNEDPVRLIRAKQLPEL
jgi:hypothetical protein